MSDDNDKKPPKIDLPTSVMNQLAALSKQPSSSVKSPIGIETKTPRDIKDYLDRFVIKQEKAKKMLATAAYKHLQRVKSVVTHKGVIPQRTNVLLLGSTGTGKTFLVQTLAKMMNLPYTNIDCAGISSVGYVGSKLADFIDSLEGQSQHLYNTKTYAKFGIVQLDEIDKLRPQSGAGGDIVTTKIQDEILRIIEGGSINGFSCEHILFIASGAFGGVIDENKVDVSKSMGFGGGIKEERVSVNEQLVAWGLKPELIGRLSAGTVLQDLEKEDLVKIMKETESSTLKNHIDLFKYEGIPLRFTKGALEAVADIAIKKGTGARSLFSVLEFTLSELQFDRLGSDNKKPIVIKKGDVREY